MSELYIGLMSGTSMDGVDTVLAQIGDADCRIHAARTFDYPPELAGRLRALVESPQTSLAELGSLDHSVGRFFARCALELLERVGRRPIEIAAIGHHGQTVFHQPGGNEPFTMQIGDPSIVAAATGITTVADFRRADVAHGGQGAPLTAAFHAWRFHRPDATQAILNVGGIANVTLLDTRRPVIGFDIGPGNTLLDLWIRRCRDEPYDRSGSWAASGTVDGSLLQRFLTEPYFAASAPKSTGRELFNLTWLEHHLAGFDIRAADVQATLAELTAVTIASAIAGLTDRCDRIVVCGGGAHNADLLERLRRASGYVVESSDAFGIPPDWVEGVAFAWLARSRLRAIPGNVPSVTGARRAVVLGGVYWSAPP